MSQFLPDGPYQTQSPSGVADITPADPETSSADIALMQRVFSAASRNVNLIPSDFMAYVVDFIQVSRLLIPITQVSGFSQFVAQNSIAASTISTTSSTYAANGGPSLTGLSNGKYVALWGAAAAGSPGVSNANMIVVGNDTEAQTIAGTSSESFTSVMAADVFTLANSGANTLEAQYASSDDSSTCQFVRRWLIALKFANA